MGHFNPGPYPPSRLNPSNQRDSIVLSSLA